MYFKAKQAPISCHETSTGLDDFELLIQNHSDKTIRKYGLTVINILLADGKDSAVFLEYLLKKYPSYYPAHLRLGEEFIKCGEYNTAISYIQKAIEVYPLDLTAIALLALVYLKLGENEKTVRQLKLLREYVILLSICWTGADSYEL